MKKASYADRYTYAQLRRIYLLQRRWWLMHDLGKCQADRARLRHNRVTDMLGYRAKYAKHLVNGARRYNAYGEITQISPRPRSPAHG